MPRAKTFTVKGTASLDFSADVKAGSETIAMQLVRDLIGGMSFPTHVRAHRSNTDQPVKVDLPRLTITISYDTVTRKGKHATT